MIEHRVVSLPLSLGVLDHYTLIVADAEASARFHVEALGFRFLRVQLVNAGSAPDGEHDMLNHVLELPDAPGRVLVITEGLTPDSIFRKYLDAYGPGVHHVAYEVDDVEAARDAMLRAGYSFTSDEVLIDPLTGLRQVFIAREHGGYFIELLERTPAAAGGEFTEHNMAALARTMEGYVAGPDGATVGSIGERHAGLADPVQGVDAPAAEVLAFLSSPGNLPRWTCHRMVRRERDGWVEARMHGDVAIVVEAAADGVTYRWELGDQSLSVPIAVRDHGSGCEVTVDLSGMPAERRAGASALLSAELELLAAVVTGTEEPARLRQQVDEAHLAVHQRRGL